MSEEIYFEEEAKVDPFKDKNFISAVERWMNLRPWIRVAHTNGEQPSDRAHLFCAKMYCAFHGEVGCVRTYLDTGRNTARIKRTFTRARDYFYAQELDTFKVRGRWGDEKF